MEGGRFFWQCPGWFSVPELPEAVLGLGRELEAANGAPSHGIGRESSAWPAAEALSRELRASWRIEGERLDLPLLRSAVIRRLGLDVPEWLSRGRREENAVSAALAMLEGRGDLDEDLLRHVHGLLAHGGGRRWGEFRDADEVVACDGEIIYRAPPPEAVRPLMRRLCRFANDASSSLPAPIRAALAHAWFVVIHPFEDGNGRMARLLFERMAARTPETRLSPSCGVSEAILARQQEYYARLAGLPEEDGMLRWTDFCLDAMRMARRQADIRADRILELGAILERGGFSDAEAYILRTMAMEPERIWTDMDATCGMEDGLVAEAGWNGLVDRGVIRRGGIVWEALRGTDADGRDSSGRP